MRTSVTSTMFSVSCEQRSARSRNAGDLVADDAHTGDRCSSSISTSSPLKKCSPALSSDDLPEVTGPPEMTSRSVATSALSVSASSSDPAAPSSPSSRSGSSSSSCLRLEPRADAAAVSLPLGRSSPPWTMGGGMPASFSTSADGLSIGTASGKRHLKRRTCTSPRLAALNPRPTFSRRSMSVRMSISRDFSMASVSSVAGGVTRRASTSSRNSSSIVDASSWNDSILHSSRWYCSHCDGCLMASDRTDRSAVTIPGDTSFSSSLPPSFLSPLPPRTAS
mmetsp:Transcript_8746/g.38587  ORF Transcript_8746/g.38587 Transcript_8746/m.38587 type:complete len:279 (-) Transcript_8746:4777-5613(-)